MEDRIKKPNNPQTKKQNNKTPLNNFQEGKTPTNTQKCKITDLDLNRTIHSNQIYIGIYIKRELIEPSISDLG